MRVYHTPRGNPCSLCGKQLSAHRIEHAPEGDPCSRCGVAAAFHRGGRKRKVEGKTTWIGIDGEGQGRDVHRYIMLGASTADASRQWWVEDLNGLSTERCLDFILNLPQGETKLIGYSLNYDWTKIFEDVSSEVIGLLARPEHEERRREGKDAYKGPKPVWWKGYQFNMQGTKCTIQRGDRSHVIWDIWKFFQSKFVDALELWKVGGEELWTRMREMKDKRHVFDKQKPEDIRRYMLEECACMAQLGEKLDDAHVKAGIPLKAYYGAGSSGAAMLTKMGIREQIVKYPEVMKQAVACAFFGGRFENSVAGPVEECLHSYDISSAYPYQLYHLPCLLHSKWTKVTKRSGIEGARQACVRYRLRETKDRKAWGPFPFREDSGAISFPLESGGGWVWLDEYLQGERLWSGVEFIEAFVLKTECDCRPFKDIPSYYLERLRIGKEGPGIVIKLGSNSCAGKIMQSIGNAPFNCWPWAGMITSGTRGQLLEFMGLYDDFWNILMTATDGIGGKQHILCYDQSCKACLPMRGTKLKSCPVPKDTGTFSVDKPLGGWEHKVEKKGMFFARPGIYFPMNPTAEEVKRVRARGIGRGVLYENWQLIVSMFQKYGVNEKVRIERMKDGSEITRFCGMKSSTAEVNLPDGESFWHRASGKIDENGRMGPKYGAWVPRPVEMSFSPMPKRDRLNPDGTLEPRRFTMDAVSLPYHKAIDAPESDLLLAEQELVEQPDLDFSEY